MAEKRSNLGEIDKHGMGWLTAFRARRARAKKRKEKVERSATADNKDSGSEPLRGEKPTGEDIPASWENGRRRRQKMEKMG